MASLRDSAGSSFVTVTAKVSVAVGAAGTLYALVQLLAALVLLHRGELEQALAALPAREPPPLALWLIAHLRTLAWGFLLVCVAFTAVSAGLLWRKAWGWWGFVAFMVLGALANFAGVAVVDALFAWMQALPQVPEAAELQAELGALRSLSLALMGSAALVFAALHGLVVWQLCRPAVRAEFAHG